MKPERLRALVGEIFVRAGMVEANARTVAEVLVWAELRGMGSHGVMRVPRYVDWMKRGDLNGRPQIKTTESGLGTVLALHSTSRPSREIPPTLLSSPSTQPPDSTPV